MIQFEASHAFAPQQLLDISLNRGGRFFSWSPAANFQCGVVEHSYDRSSLQYCSVKYPYKILRSGTEPNKREFLLFECNPIFAFSKLSKRRTHRKLLRYFSKDVTVEATNGLQEAQVSTANTVEKKNLEYLARDYGWGVRFLTQEEEEMDKVADIQAAAFHSPSPIWDNFFFMIFKAEVLSALLYKIRHSPPNRYACLVAEADYENMEFGMPETSRHKIVGVVDVTAFADRDVLFHLEGAEEYLYVSGISVSANYRRRKVATLLLKACDLVAFLWGFDYLALRAYEDDAAARNLYTRAGYKVVSCDPPWTSTWIGKKQRVLMVKRASFAKS